MVKVEIPVRSFSPLVYANLHELDVVKEWIEAYKPAIAALNEVIQSHGVSDMLGVSLLHKHFNIHEDERLLRVIDDDGITISARRTSDNATRPFSWAFSKTFVNESFGCYPIEFVEKNDCLHIFDAAISAVESNGRFRTDYFRVLAATGATNVLGLGLNVGALFKFEAGHQLMETECSPHGSRRLQLRIRPESELEGKVVIQTLWL